MNKRRGAQVLWACCVLAWLANSGAQATTAAAARSELDRALARYAAFTLAMASDSLAACYAPDGELLREDGSTLRGPAAIAGWLHSFTGVHVDSVAMTADAVQVLGADAVQWGTFAQVVSVQDHGVVHARGRFVLQWQRTLGGPWRLRRALTQSFPR